MHEGICLCGQARYAIQGELDTVTHCHCSRCRKHHGAPFATFAELAPARLRWLAGERDTAEFTSPGGAARRFCTGCGAVVPTPSGDLVRLPVGNLTGDLGLPKQRHRFVASKAPWHVLGDAHPRWPGAVDGSPGLPALHRPASAEGTTPGSCLCGAVRFAVAGAPTRWAQCHCSRCRRGRSAAHGSNAFYPAAQFEWYSGRSLVRHFSPPDAARFTLAFCAECGGGAPVERAGVPFILVPTALFDADPGARPEDHIFIGSKASWYTPQDGLPQFEGLPPSP